MREILAHHASGLTLSQAAREMSVSESAVFNYVAVIKRLLCTRTLAGCVLRAYVLGYISRPDEDGDVFPLLPDGMEDGRR